MSQRDFFFIFLLPLGIVVVIVVTACENHFNCGCHFNN